MEKYAGILYDLDGTLLNTIDMNIIPLMQIVEEETGEKKSFDELKHFFGRPGLEVMEALGFENQEAVYARWVSYVNAYPQGATMYEPLDEILKEFAEAGISQSIVSSKKRAQYAIDLPQYNDDHYMDVVILEEDTKRHKPHPDPLLLAAKKLNLAPGKLLYLGDSLLDYQACERAGMDFAYARWGSVSDEGIFKPDYVLEKPHDLRELKKYFKRKKDKGCK